MCLRQAHDFAWGTTFCFVRLPCQSRGADVALLSYWDSFSCENTLKRWSRLQFGNSAILSLNFCFDPGCRKRAGCRTCIFSRGSRAVLTLLFLFFLLEGKNCCCSAAEHRHNSSWDSWRTSCCLRISNFEYCFYGALQKFSRKTKKFWCSKCSL